MSSSPIDNYSFVHNYHYQNKSQWMSTLDFFSAPARKVLGGRSVNIIAQNYHAPSSTCSRITIVFFSVLIVPVAVISIAALIAKAATCPFLWEKKMIKKETDEAFKIFDQFEKAWDEKRYDEMISIYRKNRGIAARTSLEVVNKIFKIVNWKINDGVAWKEVAKDLSLLSANDTCNLIDHAIKERLNAEINKDNWTLKSSDILALMEGSWKRLPTSAFESWLKYFSANSLKIDSKNPDPIRDAIKIDLAMPLIDELVQRKKREADSELRMQVINLEKTVLRSPYSKVQYLRITGDEANLKKLHLTLEQVRKVHHAKQIVKGLIANKDANLKNEIQRILNILDSLSERVNNETKEYIENQNKVVLELLKLHEEAKTDDASSEKVVEISREIEKLLPDQLPLWEAMYRTGKLSFDSVESVFGLIQQKLSCSLLEFYEPLKSHFLQHLAEDVCASFKDLIATK